MAKFNSIADDCCSGGFGHCLVASVMLQSRADVVAVIGLVVPRLAQGWLVVQEDAASCRSHWHGIKVVRTKEVVPSRRHWIWTVV